MESQERLSKLSRFVASLDPKAQVKDSWHILCSCGTTVKFNHEYGVARYQEHLRHKRCGLHKGQLGITTFFKPEG